MAQAYDVVVIGSGSGGLSAAGRLAVAGMKPLVLEADDRLGGRFSTIEVDGYKVPTGAVAIETAGPFYETIRMLGIEPDLEVPDPPVMVHVRGRDLQPGKAVWNHMMKRVTKAAGRLVEGMRSGEQVADDITLDEWVHKYTRSKTVAGLFQSLSASIFTVNSDELPAGAFFRLMRETGGYKNFGYARHGNVEIADAMASAIEARGGEVRKQARVERILAEGETVTGVELADPSGRNATVNAKAIISNAGPRVTADLMRGTELESAFGERVKDVQPSSLLALAFSSERELVKAPGIWTFTDTERMCNLANLTATCPDLAPDGRKLYEAYSCPRPSVGGDFDLDYERGLLEADLEKMIPEYGKETEVVLFKAMRGSNPAQQCQPGYDLSIETPSPNLLEVGDGVKPYGWIGTTACAETARIAVERLGGSGG